MRNAVYIVLLAGVVLAWGMAGIAARSSGKSPFADIPFEHVIIDGHPPLNQWAIGVGDVGSDGQVDREILQVQQGSLYPALHRLQHRGLMKSEWKESGNGPMAKYYSLTAAGRKCLQAEMAEWQRYAGAVALVLES